MAHIRPVLDGFEVALDQDEAQSLRKSGAHLLTEVIQGTPSVSPILASEGEAEAFLLGFNMGMRAADDAVGAAYQRYRAADNEWVHIDELHTLLPHARLKEASYG